MRRTHCRPSRFHPTLQSFPATEQPNSSTRKPEAKPMLLDVNCLLAIAWPNHQHHELLRSWFRHQSPKGWRTCAVTELGFIRLSSNPSFTPEYVSPPEAVELIANLKKRGAHSYLESTSPTDFQNMSHDSIQGHKQTTDSYLLSLAEASGCQLVTLDRRVTHLTFAPAHLLVLE